MTTFDTQQPYLDDYDQLPQQRTSPLAIASIVCSLVCCCPLTTITGVILGIVSVVQIGGNPQLKGRGLAIAGIILGVIFTIAQVVITVRLYDAYATFRDAPYHALEPGFRGDYAAMRDNFGSAGSAATDEEARQFIEELRSRYGELRGSDLDFQAFQTMQQPAPGQTEFAMPWLLIFDNAVVEAEFTIREDDQVRGDVIFHQVRIIDPGHDDLVFPVTQPQTAPSPPAEAPAPPESPEDDEP